MRGDAKSDLFFFFFFLFHYYYCHSFNAFFPTRYIFSLLGWSRRNFSVRDKNRNERDAKIEHENAPRRQNSFVSHAHKLFAPNEQENCHLTNK